jgi:putative transposase
MTLSTCLGVSVSSEDPHYRYLDDLLDVTAPQWAAQHPEHHVYAAKPGKVDITFNVASDGSPTDLPKLLQEASAALKQVEAGRTAEDVARDCGVSKHTIYEWKAKYGVLEVNEAQRLRQLEDENSCLKQLVADLSLDWEMLMSIAVSSFRYEARRSDERLRDRLVELAREKPRYGYRRLQVLMERDGERVNHKRLYRVYREAGQVRPMPGIEAPLATLG